MHPTTGQVPLSVSRLAGGVSPPRADGIPRATQVGRAWGEPALFL